MGGDTWAHEHGRGSLTVDPRPLQFVNGRWIPVVEQERPATLDQGYSGVGGFETEFWHSAYIGAFDRAKRAEQERDEAHRQADLAKTQVGIARAWAERLAGLLGRAYRMLARADAYATWAGMCPYCSFRGRHEAGCPRRALLREIEGVCGWDRDKAAGGVGDGAHQAAAHDTGA